MEMTLSMGTFQALDQNEMFEIDGGKNSTGSAIGVTGGAVAFAWGTVMTIAGIGSGNVALAFSGVTTAISGYNTMKNSR